MNKLILITLSSLFLSACSLSDSVSKILTLPLGTYKPDVIQGSVLTIHNVKQLKVGMSTKQVQEIIGPPSVVDPFHKNQWDYVHHSTLGSGEIIHYRLILTFAGDELVDINTDGMAALFSNNGKSTDTNAESLAPVNDESTDAKTLLLSPVTDKSLDTSANSTNSLSPVVYRWEV